MSSSTSRDFFLDGIAARPRYTTGGPASLSAASVSPATVTGGSPSTGTVTLTGAAPTGGAVMSLLSALDGERVAARLAATVRGYS